MAHWKRRRPTNTQATEPPTEDIQRLRRELTEREGEITFLRAQLTQTLAGWREAQQRVLTLEGLEEDAGRDQPAPGAAPNAWASRA